MKQTISYAIMPGYEDEILKTGMDLKEYVASLNLDGIELLLYRDGVYKKNYKDETLGVHLRYWPNWYPLFKGDMETLMRYHHDEAGIRKYYDADSYEQWIKIIHDNIQASLKFNPEYIVWHIADATLEECYTYKFEHSDFEIVEAAAVVFNEAAKDLPDDVLVLFENLWWPGMTLTNKEAVAHFFKLVKHKKVGIMLDTGHLMNTNWDLTTENDGIEYIIKIVSELGEYKNLIKGMHLNCSLSGEFMKGCSHVPPEKYDMMEIMHYICNIDRHRPFTSSRVKELVDFISPLYITHELYYNDFQDFAEKVRIQQAACKGEEQC